jgi:D-glycero-D-manno-heptose 1,7-bisphosphate phosphatase
VVTNLIKGSNAVFLDRDGVINKAFIVNGRPTPPQSLDQLQILPGVIEALVAIRALGLKIAVVTNQPDVARRKISKSSVESINGRIQELTSIEHFYTCFHDDRDDCLCRKPKPGLIELAAEDLGVDLIGSYVVGDRWRDIEAGQNSGCFCCFIDNLYDEKQPNPPYVKVSSLAEAARIIQGDFNDRFNR